VRETIADSRAVVIGAGVVGCAIFRRLAMAGLEPVMLEAASDILDGASKGNSALLHTGFDAPEDSVELRCIQSGYREYLAIRDKLNLPLIESGALVVAWDEEQLAKLPAIVAKAHRNGVADVVQIDRDEVRRREPQLSERGLGAVHVPGEHIIDPWSAPLAYAHQGLAHGGKILRRCRVTGGVFDGTRWSLQTTLGDISAGVVINAAGNHGDLVEAINRPPSFAITPRKGSSSCSTSRRASCCMPSSCRCRPSAPRASSPAAPPSATCWSARPRRTSRTATAPTSTTPCWNS